MTGARAARVCSALVAVLLLQGGGAAQRDKDDWKRDPYTGMDPGAMQQAGYVSFGPFPWGDDHDSRKIEEMTPEAKILWVETAHFRLGTTLKSLPLPKSSKSRRRLLAEIKELRKRLPKLPARPRSLDRWLRLHLFAARLERTYARVQRLLGVTDASFPEAGQQAPASTGARYMGQGPITGMRDKFCVLLMQKASNLTRYGVKAGMKPPKEPTPVSLLFEERGSIMFGTSAEIVYDTEDTDHRLHVNVVFNTVQNVLQGYRSQFHTLPAWIDEGVANWLVRELDEEAHDFSGMREWDTTKAYPTKWDVFARNLAKNGFGASTAKLCELARPDDMTFNDHICAWSRVDFLLSIEDGARFRKFISDMKAPLPHGDGKPVEWKTVLAAQRRALQEVFGFDYDGFDAAWSQYAQRTYPRK